jgi:hypothetical protein
LAEAARLGFARAIIAASGPADADGIEVVRVRTLVEAIEAAGMIRPQGDSALVRRSEPNPRADRAVAGWEPF